MNYICCQKNQKVAIVQASHTTVYPVYDTVQFLDSLCRAYGSSYEGRKDAACRFLHIRQKVPVLVSDVHRIIFFPTRSVSSKDCIWIHHKMVERYYEEGNKTHVIFRDGQKLILAMAYRSMMRQMQRCEILQYMTQCRHQQDMYDVLYQCFERKQTSPLED